MACRRGTCHGVFFTSLADRAVEHADIRQLDGARLELGDIFTRGIMPPRRCARLLGLHRNEV